MSFEPAYLELSRNGELAERAKIAYERLADCELCARRCKVDRYSDVLGICQTGVRARMSSYGPHLGEEDPLRGWRCSGTIFFSRCNLKCQYCQNHDISQRDSGGLVEPEQLAEAMLELQELGCHNINFVSPSHVVAQIIAGVLIAAKAGLRLPLVYNTGGFDTLETLALLDGIIDIYMPDMKYASAVRGRVYSKVREYPKVNQAAVKEMHRQVGDLQLDEHGIAQRGLLVRHLVLPNGLAGTEEIVRFLAEEISCNTYLNLMNQYRPAYNAQRFDQLKRSIKPQEFQDAVRMAQEAGLNRLDERRPIFLRF
jgi:putative pyruvate formate lyase activating enzyme